MSKTVDSIRSHKNKEKPLVCLTAYTTPMAQLIAPHCNLILVGDSLGMVLYGLPSTRGVDLETMIRHGQAVVRGSGDVPVVVDLPYGTYEDSAAQALEHARRVLDETGAEAVKVEGGTAIAPIIEALVRQDVPVMAHIGLTPQDIPDGVFRVQGKTEESRQRLMADARAVADAGAFAVVIEGTLENVAADMTAAIEIPTIGIGASAACDGQILVTEDMLGMLNMHTPKFVKQYAQLWDVMEDAVKTYAGEVRERKFPSENYVYRPKK